MKSLFIIIVLALFSFSSFATTCKNPETNFTYVVSFEDLSLEVFDETGTLTFSNDLLFKHVVDEEVMLFNPHGLDPVASLKTVNGKKVISVFGEENLICED